MNQSYTGRIRLVGALYSWERHAKSLTAKAVEELPLPQGAG